MFRKLQEISPSASPSAKSGVRYGCRMPLRTRESDCVKTFWVRIGVRSSIRKKSSQNRRELILHIFVTSGDDSNRKVYKLRNPYIGRETCEHTFHKFKMVIINADRHEEAVNIRVTYKGIDITHMTLSLDVDEECLLRFIAEQYYNGKRKEE